jgi:hypothetical protein
MQTFRGTCNALHVKSLCGFTTNFIVMTSINLKRVLSSLVESSYYHHPKAIRQTSLFIFGLLYSEHVRNASGGPSSAD